MGDNGHMNDQNNNCYTLNRSIARALSLLLTLISLVSGQLWAQQLSEDQQYQQLLDLLTQQTTLATQTRLNVDFVPGTVNILKADDLEDRGFKDVWDALGFLPGVQKTIDSTGSKSLIVRGIGKNYNGGKIKFMLNGVEVNTSVSTGFGTFLSTPVSQVERIEFIRGPGSAIYGEFAVLAVVNVITRKHGEFYQLEFGQYGTTGFSSVIDFGQDSEWFSSSLNLAASQTDGEDLGVDQDRTPSGIQGYAPGNISNKSDRVSVIFGLSLADLDIDFQYQQANRGDYHGVLDYLPPDDDQTVISETLSTARVGADYQLTQDTTLSWSLSRVLNELDKNEQFLGVAELYGGGATDDDIFSHVTVREQRDSFKLDISHQMEAHQWYVQLGSMKLDTEDYRISINLDPVTRLPSSVFNEFETPVEKGQSRKGANLVIQDEWALNDASNLIFGFRYDDYSDIGDNLSPRFAWVYRLSDQDVIKAQFAEAFRPPTLLEYNGSKVAELAPEVIETLEFSWISHVVDRTVKQTLSYSKIEDLIAFEVTSPAGYRNVNSVEIAAYDLEIETALSPQFELSFNITLQDIVRHSEGFNNYEFAPLLVSAGLEYVIDPEWVFMTTLDAYAKRERNDEEARDALDPVALIDIGLHKKRLFGSPGLGLRFSIDNLTSESEQYSSPMDGSPQDYVVADAASFWVRVIFSPDAD